MTSTHSSPPLLDLPRLLDAELSRTSRFMHVVLLVGALTMTVIVASLWLTEPSLPMRTQTAFGLVTLIGLSWAAFAIWVLTARRALLARDSIVAARMAVMFTTMFIVGALALGYVNGGTAPYAAVAMGLALLVAAVVLLVRARRRVAILTTRREALERQLGRSPR
jgi:hypothetical protein